MGLGLGLALIDCDGEGLAQARLERVSSSLSVGGVSLTCEPNPSPNQVALHQRADVIIGVHGAGLANVLWARPGCHVVEVS